MAAKLYGFPISHPTQAVRRMLEVKGIDYRLAGVLPGNQKVHMRLLGFGAGTVPGLKLDGRRVQGSVAIARALEELRPDPSLFPSDPEARRRADEAERWGDEEFQDIPRRILRWGTTRDAGLRRWMATGALPLPALAARLTWPVAWYYARDKQADEDHARRDVASLPELLDRVDGMLADATLSLDPPSAASFQVLSTVRSLDSFADLHELVAAHTCADAARRLFPDDFTPTPIPPFMPRDWLPA